MRNKKAFTLIELMVVILIIGVLAGATLPLMRGRIESAKWAEGKAAAGTIRSAVRVRFAETGSIDGLTGRLSSAALRNRLGFHEIDLVGTYFVPGDYRILEVTPEGIATIRVTGSQDNAPKGSITLSADGVWTVSQASTGSGGDGSTDTGSDGGNTGVDDTGSGDTGGSDTGSGDTGGSDTGSGGTFVTPGQGATPPGQGGTPPGQGGTPPGQGGTPPGQANK